VFDILYVNTRLPDFLRGDLWAGIAGLRIGERRVLELIAKYGPETYLAAVNDYMDLGERRALAALKALPAGVYHFEEEQDSGAIHKIRLTITPEKFTVDLTDNPGQAIRRAKGRRLPCNWRSRPLPTPRGRATAAVSARSRSSPNRGRSSMSWSRARSAITPRSRSACST
jgi:hypothetical protein